jgi:predicted peptidase
VIRVFAIIALAFAGMAGCKDRPKPVADVPVSAGSEPVKAMEMTPVDLEIKGPGLHKLQVQAPSGKTVKYVVHVPEGLPQGGKVPLVVALHYAGKDSDWYGHSMIEALYADGCLPIRPVIVAPDSLTGDDWDTPENVDHVAWLTRSTLKSYPIDPKRVVLSGFSAGGIGTWYIASRVPDVFTAAIPIAGEPTLKGANWTLPVYAIHAEADTILPPAATKKQIELLKAAGKTADLFLLSDGTTHYQSNRYVPSLRQACGMLQNFVWK